MQTSRLLNIEKPQDFQPAIALRIDAAVKASGLSRSTLYEHIARGRLKAIRVGGRRLILRRDLQEFLEGFRGAA
ncbi:MAG: helix-turn-helix domain-containing protein [Hyphomicrobiaceae bacterium]